MFLNGFLFFRGELFLSDYKAHLSNYTLVSFILIYENY